MKIMRFLRRETGINTTNPPSSAPIRWGSLMVSGLVICGALAIWPRATSFVEAARPIDTDETAQDKIISTVVGGGFGSSVPAREAPVSLPIAVARDPLGRGIYFIDDLFGDRLIRFMNTTQSAVTLAGARIESGHVGLIAGGGQADPMDGANPRQVYLGGMTGLVVDPSGNAIFFGLPILNSANIFAINLSTQTFTFQDRPPIPAGKLAFINFASLPEMRSLAFQGGRFYTISTCCGGTPSSRVYKMLSGGETELVAGSGNPPEGNGDGGPANQARLINPTGVAFDTNGNMFIAEGGSSRLTGGIRKVTTDGNITSVVADIGFLSGFSVGIVAEPSGSFLVPFGNGQRIVRVTGGSFTPLVGDASGFSCSIDTNPTCGDGGPAIAANLNLPGSSSEQSYQLIQMAVDATGFFFPDAQRGQDSKYAHVRYVNFSNNPVNIAGTTIAKNAVNSVLGNGKAPPYDGIAAPYATLNSPSGVAFDSQGNMIISDTLNHRLRFVNLQATAVTLFPGTPSSQTVDPGRITTLNKDVGASIGDDRIATAFFDSLQGLTTNANGIFIADAQNGTAFPAQTIPSRKSGLIRFLNTSSSPVVFYPGSATPITVPPGQVKILAGLRPGPGVSPVDIGDGGFATAAVIFTGDVAVDATGTIFIADYHNNRVRRVDANTGIVTSILTGLNKPTGVAIDGSGRLLVADTYNNRIMRQNAAGSADFTNIGDGTLNPAIQRPRDMTVSGGKIYITSSGSNRVLELNAPSNALGTTAAFAANGAPGFAGDGGPALDALLMLPNQAQSDINQGTLGIAVQPGTAPAIVFVDPGNDRIRKVTLATPPALVVSANGANYSTTELATESIVAAFGTNMATAVGLGNTVPLPTSLIGTIIKVKDSGNVERMAGEFYVSPGQCNYELPPGTAIGPATVTITSGSGQISVGTIQVATVAPGIFSANSTGQGLAAAIVLRVRGGQQTVEQISQFNPNTMVFDPIQVDLGPPTDQVFLIMFGTGFRFRSSLAGVVVKVGGRTHATTYAGPVQGFVALDQLNFNPLSRELIGAGLVNIEVTVDGKVSNTTTVSIK